MLDHKDLLIREVNHRVKNALMTVTTLLDLQRRMEPDDSVRSRLATARGRVAAIANLQRHLYKGRTLARVEMSAYLGDLAAELVEHLGGGRLRVEVDVQAMDLPSEVAVPIGLVVNEFVTNACKHAFPEGRTGTIRIGLWCRGADILVQVEDDGVGMSDNGGSAPIHRPKASAWPWCGRWPQNLEGKLAIEPIEPGGTRMKVRFPAPDQADAAH